jgi:hypothetical protein
MHVGTPRSWVMFLGGAHNAKFRNVNRHFPREQCYNWGLRSEQHPPKWKSILLPETRYISIGNILENTIKYQYKVLKLIWKQDAHLGDFSFVSVRMFSFLFGSDLRWVSSRSDGKSGRRYELRYMKFVWAEFRNVKIIVSMPWHPTSLHLAWRSLSRVIAVLLMTVSLREMYTVNPH